MRARSVQRGDGQRMKEGRSADGRVGGLVDGWETWVGNVGGERGWGT